MSKANFIKDKIASGQTVLGIWTILNSAQHCEVMAEAGLDFQILDLEHGTFDTASLDQCIRSCLSSDCSPLVRPASASGTQIQTALDLGAHGVVVPQVTGISEAQDVVAQCHYFPKGRRGFNPFTRAGSFSPSRHGHQRNALKDGFGLTSVIIENQSALDDIDRVLEIKEIDMLYLGVYDMSLAFGCNGDVNHPKVKEFVKTLVPKIRSAGKSAGLMVKNEEEMKAAVQLGANFLVYGVDTFLLSRAIKSGFDELERARS
jgi:4-hydroxy-2-oxoheptanedioate aldolase